VGLSRVVVLANRPVEGKGGKTVDRESNLITERNTPGWPGPFYKSSRQDPEAAYG
jgi:hypothetical protein